MSASTSAAQAFFSGTFVDLWLRVMSEEQTRREVDFLEKVLRLSPGSKVLDVACGGGRHSLELAGRGYQVTGVDLSPDFLAVARSKAAERRAQVVWEQRAMQDLPWQGEFDAAFCLGNSLGGLDDADLAAAFRAVARALKSGGRFAVDNGAIAECLFPSLKERFWFPAEDIYFLIHNRYDPVRGRLDIDFTFIRDGQLEKKSNFQQVYTCREFCRLLAEAGFVDFEPYGSPALEPFQLGSHGLYLAAARNRD